MLRAKVRRSIPEFLHWLEVVRADYSWRPPHLTKIREGLEKIRRGEIDRLMIDAPPRHGKSEHTTIHWPAYLIEEDPYLRIMLGAYSSGLAYRFSRRIRSIVGERVGLSKIRTAVQEWETMHGGGVLAGGVGGGFTGHGAGGILIDDPVKSRAEAESKAYRDKCFDWYTDDLSTRLEPNGWVVLQMTRWHEDDLAGRILASEEGGDWTRIHLPALAEEGDILGREEGEALWPMRYDEKALYRLKRRLGSSFYALFQGNPTSAEGAIIKKPWIRRYHTSDMEEIILTVQSWDTASKTKEMNDYSVCTTWKISRNKIYLWKEYRERLDYPNLKKRALEQYEIHAPDVVLIEDKGNGIALIQDLKTETAVPVVAVEPIADKVVRLSVQSPAYEVGQVWHPEPVEAPWIIDFEEELTKIPNAPNDDRGDSVSQALAYIRKSGNAFRFHFIEGDLVSGHAPGDDVSRVDTETGFGRVTRSLDTTGF